MKLIKTLIMASAFVAGSATASTVDQATSSANVNVKVENGVATLLGHVDDGLDRIIAGQAAARIDGVEEVRNLLTFSR